jgi:ribose transport system substrate-binding protein
MRACCGLAAISPAAWGAATSAHSRLEGARAALKSPEKASKANAIHGEIASAALSRQAITAPTNSDLSAQACVVEEAPGQSPGRKCGELTMDKADIWATASAELGRAGLLKKLLIASAVVSVAALAGPSFAADKPTIPIIVKDTTSAYWQIVFAGARAAAKDLNVNVPELGAQSESDINGEISILENAVAEKPAAVVIAPTEFKALGKPIDEAAKKVPIIGVDSAADSKAFTSFLTTDNVQGGRIAADGMAAAIAAKYGKAEGEVALITHLPGVGSLEARNKGYKEELAAKYPGLKLVADKVSDGNATTGLNIMTDLITANPNLRGVFADNLIQCQGASQAVAENKKGDTIKLVCFDADDKLIGYLKDGTIAALLLQDPYRMGYDGIKTALAASKGEKVEAFVDTGANLVTKANMDGEKEHALLYPKVK